VFTGGHHDLAGPHPSDLLLYSDGDSTMSEKETKLHTKMAERVPTESPKQSMDVVPNSSADPTPVERRSSKQRSRMTNGTALLPDIDGRSAIARRFKDITSGILADQGGADQCSESRLQLVRRFAAAAVLAEQLESRLANGEQIDIQEHALLCSTLARLASRIGIDRRAKNITPTLSDYLVGPGNGGG
jgi:hypothetical protein